MDRLFHSRIVVLMTAVLVVALIIGLVMNKETDYNVLPTSQPMRTYYLENPTRKEKMERLLSVALFEDGTAVLATPPISSYLLPSCTYVFTEDELVIYASIDTEKSEKAYGLKNGEVVARFTVEDDKTLIFHSSTVPLFADKGARYIYSPVPVTPDNGLNEAKSPEKAPRLEIVFIEDKLTEKRIQAAQLTTSWNYEEENGKGYSYEADSPHPLQLNDYDRITLQLHGTSAEIMLFFTDNFPPQSVSVQRWNAKYAGDDLDGIWDNGEEIRLHENGFTIDDDGNDYIYEVYARWEQGSSYYAFRVNAAE